ncbi:DUF3306 domain-containing protein [Halomonas sp. NO4]|uniref:DUF3306 domain-containing protein n=1 Tax=Halomonas sp. NO4 TaxID=2484813 RepID=UPI0013D0A4DB|nr:DUF3306 domain-containing protein [Halomonas sp. NO4]
MNRLNRWSERKRAGQAVPASDAPAHTESSQDADAMVEAPREASADATPPPEPGSLDHTLPDPDSLAPGSDIKAFLSPGVSAGLRRRALRRLFAADHYGVRDGLDDYDDDYRRQLQPLASELAQRLRQWTRQVSGEEGPREVGTSETAGGDHATGHSHDEEVAADNSSATTGEEDETLPREAVPPQSALDEGCSGKNAESDQH